MVQGKAHVIDRTVRSTGSTNRAKSGIFRRHSREMQSRNSQTLKLAPTENTILNYGIMPERVMKLSHNIIRIFNNAKNR